MWTEGEWNYLLHRRPASEFFQLEERMYKIGEWFTLAEPMAFTGSGVRQSHSGIPICEWAYIDPLHSLNFRIMKWMFPFEEVGLYESGYADGYLKYDVNQELLRPRAMRSTYGVSESQFEIYMMGYDDGLGDLRSGKVYDIIGS